MDLKDFTHDIDGNEIAFKCDTKLKPAGIKLAYTKEHVEEFMKCSKDWRYFIENYHHIVSLDEGVVKIKLRDYQLELIDNYINNRFNIVLASRQCGKTESYVGFILWYILFNQDKSVAILANKLKTTKGILRKVKQSYGLLPKYLQQGVVTWNTTEIVLQNGCSVYAAATTSSSIRSGSSNIVIIDECAFISHGTWSEFYESTYPTISSSKESKIIMVSTPNGMNHYYKFWQDAIDKKNQFKPVRVDWWQVPGRDEKWKEQTIENTSQVSFNQEYGNSFLGSIQTLIDPKHITELKHAQPIECPIFDKLTENLHRYLNIYEPVKKNHVYAVGVDSAKMTEDNAGDGLGMQVLDITEFPIRQVATFFAEEGISYLSAPEIIVELCKYYNNALLFIENNEIGQEVANIVHFDLEYEYTYFEKGNLPGFRTTKKTKRLGCTNLKLLVENNKLVLNDFTTISQLSTFIKKKTSYEAEKSYKDDLIMSLIAALYVLLAEGLDLTIIESISDLGKKVIERESVIHTEEPPDFAMPDDEYETKPKGDFDWL